MVALIALLACPFSYIRSLSESPRSARRLPVTMAIGEWRRSESLDQDGPDPVRLKRAANFTGAWVAKLKDSW